MLFLFPPISGETPLAALGLCSLRTYCPRCGQRERQVSQILQAVPPQTELSRVFARLRCDTCQAPPLRVDAINAWIAGWGRVPESVDISHLLPERPSA